MGSMQSLEWEKWALRDTENYGKDTGNSIGDISECDRDFVVIIKGNGPGRRVTINMNSELTQWLEENLEKNDLLLTPEYSMNEVTMSGAMLYCGWPYYAWSAGYDTNYRAAQAVTIYTTSDSETLKKTVQQEKITYILFEEGSEFEQQECREETIAAAYEKVYETQDGRIRIYKTTE